MKRLYIFLITLQLLLKPNLVRAGAQDEKRLEYTGSCVNCSLEYANFAGKDLSNKNLKGANLSNANLKGANLENVYLQKANLQNTNLEGANLKGTNLEGADLEGTNLKHAFYDEKTKWSNGFK